MTQLTESQKAKLESLSEAGKTIQLRAWQAMALVGRAATAAIRHVSAGCPNPPQSVIDERMEICKACPNWKSGTCGICGCGLKSKTSWALEKCPDKPSRWPQWTGSSQVVRDLDDTVGSAVENAKEIPVAEREVR